MDGQQCALLPEKQSQVSSGISPDSAAINCVDFFFPFLSICFDSQVAVGLEVERQQLEHECNTSQEDALSEESRYHFLQSLCSITDARLESVRRDER